MNPRILINKCLCLGMLLLLVATLPAQETAARPWQAQWIWDASKDKNLWMCFRKQIELAKVPEKVEARIAVDSKYWLWINAPGQNRVAPCRQRREAGNPRPPGSHRGLRADAQRRESRLPAGCEKTHRHRAQSLSRFDHRTHLRQTRGRHSRHLRERITPNRNYEKNITRPRH